MIELDQKIIDSCVRCGLCLTSCPTYLEKGIETSSPRGRIALLNAVNHGRLAILDRGVTDQMYECLDCRACAAVCPSGVEYGKLVEGARSLIETMRRPTYDRKTRVIRGLTLKGLFYSLPLLYLLITLLVFYQRSGLQTVVRHTGILKLLRLVDLEHLLPPLDWPPLSRRGTRWFLSGTGKIVEEVGGKQKHPPGKGVKQPQTKNDRKEIPVALFGGCMMSTALAGTSRATARVLVRNGCTVEAPSRQRCCGALHLHAGDEETARELARANIAAFERGENRFIVVNAAGCGATLKEYPYLLREDERWYPRALTFAARVRDISELLVRELPTFIPPPSGPAEKITRVKVTYQEACHLAHAQRITQPPRDILKSIPGLELVEMEESSVCCGSAGIYNLTQPEMATRLGDRKARHAEATGAALIATSNPGCLFQLNASLRRVGSPARARHIVDILDEAYEKNIF